MHLGRFHHVVDHLERHFREAKLTEQLEAAATALDQFTQSRSESYITVFRTALADALEASDAIAPELLQPYAQQVIQELGLNALLPPKFRNTVQQIVDKHGFDSAALSVGLREFNKSATARIGSVSQLDASLRKLSAEYTAVEDERAEIGLLLPREVVGEKLPDLSKEFDKMSSLMRAVNELTGQPDYDSRVVTISSSWWQVFVDVPIDQVALWIVAIERIVNLFKSNLEIKNLQKLLGEKDMPESILNAISEEVDKKVSSELEQISSDLVQQFGKIDDGGRRNELETQLRHGLHYLARRMNQGAQVELNVGLPDEPEDPEPRAGETVDPAILTANQQMRERLATLRELRDRAMNASETSLQIAKDAPLLLEDVKTQAPDQPRQS